MIPHWSDVMTEGSGVPQPIVTTVHTHTHRLVDATTVRCVSSLPIPARLAATAHWSLSRSAYRSATQNSVTVHSRVRITYSAVDYTALPSARDTSKTPQTQITPPHPPDAPIHGICKTRKRSTTQVSYVSDA